jgi:hypothetical protein
MKKTLLVLASILLFSCSSDDNSAQNETTLENLCDTEWNFTSPVVDGYQQEILFWFQDDMSVKYVAVGFIDGDEVDSSVFQGVYTYESPEVELEFRNGYCGENSLSRPCFINATVDGNVFVINQNGEDFEFNRDTSLESNCD